VKPYLKIESREEEATARTPARYSMVASFENFLQGSSNRKRWEKGSKKISEETSETFSSKVRKHTSSHGREN
jgi:hypothetical protein